MNDLELKRKRIETGVKIAALLGISFIAAPFVFVAIQGFVGLLIAGAIGLTAINLAPWAAAKIANWRLKALKHEAAKNPVETLQNDYIKRQTALADFGQAITTFAAKVATFADKLVEFKREYPEEVEKFNLQLDKMKQLLRLRQNKYKAAQEKLADYEQEIQKAGAIWEMGLAAQEMTKAAGMTEADFFAKIQVETALDSVQTKLNESFAELEMALLDEEDSKEDKKTAHQLKNQTDSIANSLKTSSTPTPESLRTRSN